VRAGGVAYYGQLQMLVIALAILLVQKEGHGFNAGSVHGADAGHGGAQFARQLEGVNVPAARVHQIAHVQQHQRRQPQGEHGRSQHQLAGQVQRIEHQKNGVGLGRVGHSAAQHVDGDPRILGVGRERIDAGQIDESQVVAAHAGHQTHALLDGDAGIVGHLLTKPGEPVEEGGFAGIRRTDERDGSKRSLGGRRGGRLEGRRVAACVHPAASAAS